MKFHFKSFKGPAVVEILDDIARLRISIFREYPYLYDGDMEYERKYLANYAESKAGLVILCYDEKNQVVGGATGVPIINESEELQEPLRRYRLDLAKIFYLGEFLLKPEFRGSGIGKLLIDLCHAHATNLDCFEWTALCTIVRPHTHPLKPLGYRSADTLWLRSGYTQAPGIVAQFPWREVGQTEETPKPMQYWLRRLAK